MGVCMSVYVCAYLRYVAVWRHMSVLYSEESAPECYVPAEINTGHRLEKSITVQLTSWWCVSECVYAGVCVWVCARRV